MREYTVCYRRAVVMNKLFLSKISKLSIVLLASTFSVYFSAPAKALTEADCDRIYNSDTSNWGSIVAASMY